MRERHHDDPWLRPRVVPRLGQALEEVGPGAQRHLADVGAGQQRAVDVDRIGRGRHQRGVARLQQRPHQVREPLLGPDGVDHLGLGVELHAEPPQVEVGERLAQLRDAPARGVAVVAGVVHGLGQLLDRHVGRGEVRVAEAQVDHVGAGSPGLDLQRVDDGEDVGRQRRDPAELHGAQRYSRSPPPPAHDSLRNGVISRASPATASARRSGPRRWHPPRDPAPHPRCARAVAARSRARASRTPRGSGARSSSPASASPPPITTTSGSSRFSRFDDAECHPPGEVAEHLDGVGIAVGGGRR